MADGLIAESRFVFGVVLVSMLASGMIIVGSYWEQQRQAAEVRRLEEREAQRAELRRIIEDLDALQQRMTTTLAAYIKTRQNQAFATFLIA